MPLGLHRHHDQRLVLVGLAVAGVGQHAHPVGLRAVGRPHLAAVDHPVAADPAGIGLDRGDVGAGAGLRHAEAGDIVAADRRREELLAQLVAAVAGERRRRHRDLHAGRHRDRAAIHQAERFRADHGVGEIEPRAAELDRLVDAQQAGIAHLLEQLMGGKGAFLLPLVDMRIDLAVDQRLPGLAQRLVLGREFHRGCSLRSAGEPVGLSRAREVMGLHRGGAEGRAPCLCDAARAPERETEVSGSHIAHILATPKVMGLSGRTINSRAIERVKASTRRVSRGSMMPSSHRCAVP